VYYVAMKWKIVWLEGCFCLGSNTEAFDRRGRVGSRSVSFSVLDPQAS